MFKVIAYDGAGQVLKEIEEYVYDAARKAFDSLATLENDLLDTAELVRVTEDGEWDVLATNCYSLTAPPQDADMAWATGY